MTPDAKAVEAGCRVAIGIPNHLSWYGFLESIEVARLLEAAYCADEGLARLVAENERLAAESYEFDTLLQETVALREYRRDQEAALQSHLAERDRLAASVEKLKEALEQIANPDQVALHTSAHALQEMARAALKESET